MIMRRLRGLHLIVLALDWNWRPVSRVMENHGRHPRRELLRANPESSADRWIPGSSPSGRAWRGLDGDAPE
jgi:hypothetical protein